MFFNQFPKTTYSIQNDGIINSVTDYFRYVDIIERLATNVYAYKKVDIVDGERPDNLSLRLYKTPDYYWTFFISNDELKEGLSAWPKSDQEMAQHIKNQYENISAFRFPMSDEYTDGRRLTPLGIPMKNEAYAPYLYLCNLMQTYLSGKRVFAKAKIIDYDPTMSLIWIDKSTISWYSDDETVNDQVGSGTSSDNFFQSRAEDQLFYSGAMNAEFSIQFHSDGTTTANQLRKEYIDEVREAAVRFQPNGGFDTKSYATLDMDYEISSTQYWKDGSLAPAYYYNTSDTTEVIPEYEAGPEATNYTTINDEMIEKNNDRRTIKVVAPSYIESFVREYKRLLNE
jgi:hypothetical protein